jgi:hypothetical protein
MAKENLREEDVDPPLIVILTLNVGKEGAQIEMTGMAEVSPVG